MANTRTIRSRIRSVQNISKITKAMEMIASSKMRKAQERAWQDGLIRKKLSRLLLIWLL